MVKPCGYNILINHNINFMSIIGSFYNSSEMSGGGDIVTGSFTCTGSEQKLYECFDITEQNECSHAVVHCQPGIPWTLRLLANIKTYSSCSFLY